jgi:hypothetical protein
MHSFFNFVRTGCIKVPVECSLGETVCVVLLQQNRHLDIQCLDWIYTCNFVNRAEGMCD